MKKFMDENFLLSSGTAQKLYHEYAEKMPVLDYHCHISPQEIAEDGRFENIARIWLDKDHYKWRQMRSAGVEERYITGDAPDREKFQKWAQTLEKAVGNPLYHWSHLELKRYFGYEGVLNGETAQEVWDWCNARIIEQDISPRSLLVQSHVTLLCTTDDPADDLKWHKRIREDKDFHVKVLPAWRPEAAMNISLPGFPDYIKRLGRAADMEILTFAQMKKALSKRMDFFHEMGCRISDHSLDYAMYVPASDGETEEIFAKALTGQLVSCKEELKYKTAFLLQTGKEYRKRGWAMQLHYGVKRNNNKKLYRYFGADAGADCIDNHTPSSQLADLLNALDEEGGLPKTILYSLNPSDNAAIDTITGCFQNGECAGKIQHGSAWWFNDHKQGIRDQMISLANLGLLGDFIGMLTDSRSFLSYTRHEYFRRILCDLIGGWVENGEYPNDEKALERLVKDISYRNAVRYFGFDL
ncbi:glucuronate isomerase [Lachnospiraceae bacterium]|jgi:glucuronate isomerase|nr:glucuronate isomerase [Lachnospiraceae bacterium]